jgi:hypothetical protein
MSRFPAEVIRLVVIIHPCFGSEVLVYRSFAKSAGISKTLMTLMTLVTLMTLGWAGPDG